MSKVLKAHQLTVSGFWRPDLTIEPAKRYASSTDSTYRKQEIDEYLKAAQAEAAKLLTAAQAEADTILAQAEAELGRQQEIGYQAGLKAGLAAGKTQGEAAWQAKLDELGLIRQELIARDASLLQEAEQEAIELALAVAERVINHKLRHDDAVVQAALQQVLEVAKGSREALLLVAAEDFSLLWQKRTEWKNLLPGVKEFTIQADPTLTKGDLILETNQGTIDACVDTVLEQVAAQFSSGEQA